MLIVHLFVSYAHVNLCHFFSSSCCRGLAAASACGSSWIFLFTFLDFFNDCHKPEMKKLIEFDFSEVCTVLCPWDKTLFQR